MHRLLIHSKDWLRTRVPGLVDVWHRMQGIWAAYRWGNPASSLKIICITGTNGKTTTATMVAHILREAGKKVGVLTTYEFQIDTKKIPNDTKMTTMVPSTLYKLLRQMVEAGCEYAVLEVTSHALRQHRIRGIIPRVAVFTNLTHDHLDFHETFGEYRKAKLMLFEHNPRTSVVNADDPSSEHFLKLPAFQHFTYGFAKHADITARKVLSEVHATLFTAVTPVGQIAIDLKVPGRFNVSNALAALAVGIAEGIPLPVQKHALETFGGVPGRMEQVKAGQPFDVIVDFAHSPDALQKIYETLRPTTRGRLISVLGAMGRRDTSKRPIMGALAGRFADLVIVTNEDPVDEDPLAIMQQVARGVPRGAPKRQKKIEGKDYFIIPDRREAIEFALTNAKKGDTVIITGKGGEHWMLTAEGKIPWDDVEIAKSILEKHYART